VAVLNPASGETRERAWREWTALLASRWVLAVVLAVTLVPFAPTLADWFSGDDFWFLHAGQTNSNLFTYIGKSFDPRNTGQFLEYDRYRPLYPIAWRYEYALFGLHAWAYHAVLVGMHLVCVALVWLIARRLFAEAWAAHLAALIFGLHPAYADAVSWLSGGNRVFEAAPYLASLLLFMAWHDGPPGERRLGAYLGAFALYVVAVLFHSSALPLAVVFAAYAFILRGEPRDALRWRAWLPFVPFAAVVAGETAVQYWVRGHIGAEQAYRWGYHQFSNYGQYLALTLAPVSTEGRGGALLRALELWQAGAVATMLAITVALLMTGMRYRLGLFALVWYWAAFLPDSTFILTGSQGRALYVPGAAIAVLLVATLIWLVERLPRPFVRQALVAAPLALAAGVVAAIPATYDRMADTRHESARNERFYDELGRAIPSLPDGATLYVVGAPKNLLLFGSESRLQALVQLRYGPDVRAHAATPQQADAVEARARPDERVFRYRP
jgi:hypothetical protein